MTKDNNYYVNEFTDGLLEQEKGLRESLGRTYVRKQEQRYSKAVAILVESEAGINLLVKLLNNESSKVALTAAVYFWIPPLK